MAVSIILPGYTNAMRHAPARDIVFVARSGAKVTTQFAVGYLQTSGALQITELRYQDQDGIMSPVGIYRIDGEIVLAQNSDLTVNAALRMPDTLFEMHVHFRDDTALSIPYKDRKGKGLSLTGEYQYLADRYPFIQQYRSRFGVKLSNMIPFGGVSKEIRFSVSGITCEASQWSCNETDFYRNFPGLNRGRLEDSKKAQDTILFPI